jgi:hypothetical protein
MHNETSRLAARVAAQNRLNAEINRYVPLIRAVLEPYAGKKVRLAGGGGWPHKLKTELDAALGLPYRHDLALLLRTSLGEHTLILDGHADTPGTVGPRAEVQVHIAGLDNGTLGAFFDYEPLRTDITVDEVTRLREELKVAKAAVSDLQGKLYFFGEYDR